MKSDKLTRPAPARSNEWSGQRLFTGFVAIAIAALLVLACSAQQVQKQSSGDVASPPNSGTTTDADRTAALPKDLPLRILSDVPLTGGAIPFLTGLLLGNHYVASFYDSEDCFAGCYL